MSDVQNKYKSLPKQALKDLNLEDDFLFAKVMSDSEICRKVLEKILGISIKEVVMPTTQRTIDILFESKGIRLDVYVNDDNGTVYNVEMQRGKKASLPKRTRYYQGSIDLDLIASGDDYTKLRKSFVIFICCFDPFNAGLHHYTFENLCLQNTAISLGDETTKIFLNTKGTADDVDDEMLEFLAYVENTTDAFAMQSTSPLIKDIHKRVLEVKESKEMEVEFMTLLQRDRENIAIGREEGREEGIELGREEGIELGRKVAAKAIRLYQQGKTTDEIAALLKISIDSVYEIIDDYENE